MKFLGHHNIAAYGERRDLLTTSLAARDINIANYSWSSANDLASYPLRGNTYRQYPRYYVGGKVTDSGPIYDYAPAESFQFLTQPLTWFTSARTRVQEGANIQEVIQSGNSKDREIRTSGVTWQGFFWRDRDIVDGPAADLVALLLELVNRSALDDRYHHHSRSCSFIMLSDRMAEVSLGMPISAESTVYVPFTR